MVNFSACRIEHPHPAPIPIGGEIVHLTARNTIILFDALGIVTSGNGRMEVDKFLTIANNWRQDNKSHPARIVVTRETTTEQIKNVYDIGAATGYVSLQLSQIMEMLAAAPGATHLCWVAKSLTNQ